MTDEFPNEFIRGISSSNEQFITPEGYPTQAAFKFDDYSKNCRKDDYCELSINWVDDEGAVDVLLNQVNTKKNCLQFCGGYCRFKRQVLKEVFRAYISNKHVSYERRPIEADPDSGIVENHYHGNILMKNQLSKSAKTNIQVALAAIAGTVIRR